MVSFVTLAVVTVNFAETLLNSSDGELSAFLWPCRWDHPVNHVGKHSLKPAKSCDELGPPTNMHTSGFQTHRV